MPLLAKTGGALGFRRGHSPPWPLVIALQWWMKYLERVVFIIPWFWKFLHYKTF